MYKTLYNICNNKRNVLLDSTKYSISYIPRSLDEKFGIHKKDDKKDKVVENYEEKKDEKKADKKDGKKEEKTEKKEEKKEKKEDMESGVCGIDSDGVKHICGSDSGSLYPIMDPRFNLREASKNMILLEDHLFHSGKRCHDCILKHSMTIEAFLEEGVTLDKTGEYKKVLIDSSNKFRDIFDTLVKHLKSENLGDKECTDLAQEIRKIRKPLCQNYATFLKP